MLSHNRAESTSLRKLTGASRKSLATLAIFAVLSSTAVANAASSTPGTETGTDSFTNQTWHCSGPQDHHIVNVTITDETVGDAIHLEDGCTGTLETHIITNSVDGFKVHRGTHDLTVTGSVYCGGKHGVAHQDGVQALGGENVQFGNGQPGSFTVTCPTGNNGGIWVNTGIGANSIPKKIVGYGADLWEGNAAAHIGENSLISGVRNSVLRHGTGNAAPSDCYRVNSPERTMALPLLPTNTCIDYPAGILDPATDLGPWGPPQNGCGTRVNACGAVYPPVPLTDAEKALTLTILPHGGDPTTTTTSTPASTTTSTTAPHPTTTITHTTTTISHPTTTTTAPPSTPSGYRVVTSSGQVLSYGLGDLGNINGCSTVAGIAVNPSRTGIWGACSDGSIRAVGTATNFGSMAGHALNARIIGITPTGSGNGYWLLAADGGIFSFGDAAFYGSTGSMKLNKPVVAMASTASGRGYWLIAADGGVFAFGDAAFYGSTGSMKLNQPIVGVNGSATGRGYRMIAADGGIFAFGDTAFYGSTGSLSLNKPIVSATPTITGRGYWMLASDGGIFCFGDAQFLGSAVGAHVGSTAIAITNA